MEKQKAYIVGEFILTDCPQCLKNVPVGNYCSNCQFPLPQLRKSAPKVKCLNCQSEVIQDSYCSSCGLDLLDAELLHNYEGLLKEEDFQK